MFPRPSPFFRRTPSFFSLRGCSPEERKLVDCLRDDDPFHAGEGEEEHIVVLAISFFGVWSFPGAIQYLDGKFKWENMKLPLCFPPVVDTALMLADPPTWIPFLVGSAALFSIAIMQGVFLVPFLSRCLKEGEKY